MRLRHSALALMGLLSLAILSPIQAQVIAPPQLINFQGRLARPDGTPVVDGNYSIRFSLWTAVSGGTEKWNQTMTVAVKNGTFAALLGVSTGAADKFNGDLYMEIKIGTAVPLTPRQQLASVAYAMKANTVPDNSLGAAKLLTDFASLVKVSGGVLSGDGTNVGLNDHLLRLRGLGDGNHALGYFGTYGGAALDGPALFGFSGGALGYVDTRVLTWTNTGRVGIGTATPATTLDVNGIAQMTGFKLTAGAGAGRVLTSDASGVGTWQAAGAGSGWGLTGNAGINPATNFLGTTDNQPLVFRTTNVERMRISSGADIGLQITGNNFLEVGFGVAGKEANGGRIAYQRFSDGLDIVGAGTSNANRKVQFFAEGGTTFNGPIQTAGIATLAGFKLATGAAAGRVLTSDATGIASWQSAGAGSGWSLTGNAGTNPSTNFLGTTDAQSLVFRTGNTEKLRILDNGNVGIGTSTPSTKLHVNGEITATVVAITGGSDVAEPYEVANAGAVKAIPGYVVAIDSDKVGQMRVANRAYDTTVAGIISGANGINPGITLRQKGTVADGSLPVASIGRVWCWCDADASGPIVAGDLLTTSDTPGHAMKAVDRERRDGAVIGKAMSSLKSGKGLVLVLVSLK